MPNHAPAADEPSPFRSTADARRSIITSRAVTVFARNGYWATPVADVAKAAGVSQTYVFRLFDDKLNLFLAALEHCHEQILRTLGDVAERRPDEGPNTCSRRWATRTPS